MHLKRINYRIMSRIVEFNQGQTSSCQCWDCWGRWVQKGPVRSMGLKMQHPCVYSCEIDSQFASVHRSSDDLETPSYLFTHFLRALLFSPLLFFFAQHDLTESTNLHSLQLSETNCNQSLLYTVCTWNFHDSIVRNRKQ